MSRVTVDVELGDYDESTSLWKGGERSGVVKKVRGGFLAMNATSGLSQKMEGGTIIANAIGNPRKVGENAKFFSFLRSAYDRELRFPRSFL